jgi:vesicle-associated membrane protein 7
MISIQWEQQLHTLLDVWSNMLPSLIIEVVLILNSLQKMNVSSTYVTTYAMEKLQTQVDEVKQMMVQNIDKMLEREENLSLLHDKSNELSAQTHRFELTARSASREAWWKNTKVVCTGIAIVVGLLLLIVVLRRN